MFLYALNYTSIFSMKIVHLLSLIFLVKGIDIGTSLAVGVEIGVVDIIQNLTTIAILIVSADSPAVLMSL